MRLYVGVTDQSWYTYLAKEKPDEVNFWKPGTALFHVLRQNELFLFKLHHPDDWIVGGGFFVRFSLLPPIIAWQAFGTHNGTATYEELWDHIAKYRGRNGMDGENTQIGCVVLADPFFLPQSEWIPVPQDWKSNIVQGKTYDTETFEGQRLYQQVRERLQGQPSAAQSEEPRYGTALALHRLGQGAFRVVVTEAYHKRCAITGEKTLPVLEAAHIKPYAQNGPHDIHNGLLLRSDFHTLFDEGYITVTPDLHVEVSSRLHQDYGNGRDYYRYHGQLLQDLPSSVQEYPAPEFLSWHNEHCFKG